jgi:hypothetical protein
MIIAALLIHYAAPTDGANGNELSGGYVRRCMIRIIMGGGDLDTSEGQPRESGNQPSEGARTPSWLEDTLRRFNFIAAMRDRKQIRRICKESLDLYRQIEIEMPQASNQDRYARLIEKRSGADAEAVLRIMRRAEESFATWPIERPLSLRDIVQYMVVTDGFKTDIAVDGVRSRAVDLAIDIVPEMIPADL